MKSYVSGKWIDLNKAFEMGKPVCIHCGKKIKIGTGHMCKKCFNKYD